MSLQCLRPCHSRRFAIPQQQQSLPHHPRGAEATSLPLRVGSLPPHPTSSLPDTLKSATGRRRVAACAPSLPTVRTVPRPPNTAWPETRTANATVEPRSPTFLEYVIYCGQNLSAMDDNFLPRRNT